MVVMASRPLRGDRRRWWRRWQPLAWPPTRSYTAAIGTQAAGSSTFVLTLVRDVPVGDTLVLAASSNSAVTAASSVADSSGGSNTYTQRLQDTTRSPNLTVFTMTANTLLRQGVDTITVTFAGTATVKNVIVRGCTGGGFVNVDVATFADLGSGTAPSVGPSATLASPTEWALAFVAAGAASLPPVAWSGGFNGTEDVAGQGPYLSVADLFTTSASPLTAGATITSSTWTIGLITLGPPQQGTATLVASADLTAPPLATQLAPASLAADTSVTAPAAQAAPATLTALTALTDAATQDAPATLAAGGTIAAPAVVERAPATLAAGFTTTTAVTQLATATLAAGFTITGLATQLATATLTAQASVSDAAVQRAIATLAAATAVTASTGAAGAASLVGTSSMGLVVATQGAGATLAAAAAIPAPVAREAATALLAALASVTAAERTLAAATLAAAWLVDATGFAASAVDLLEGIAAGPPHSPWAAGPPHGAGYAAGAPHNPWAARPAHG